MLILHSVRVIALLVLVSTFVGCSAVAGDDDVTDAPGGTAGPSGEIAFTHDSGGIYLINADGSDPRQLIDEGAEPVWSPDGSQIAFTTTAPRGETVLAVMDADGSNARMLTEPPAFASEPAWSPDGSMIAFVQMAEPEPPTSPVAPPSGTAPSVPSSPEPQPVASEKLIFVIEPDGSGLRQLVPSHAGGANQAAPTWSPDGQRIAFLGGGSREEAHIVVANADGSNLQEIASGLHTIIAPGWSPTSDQIAFTGWADPKPGVYVINADGSSQMRLAEGQRPAWSPDGKRIAFFGEDGLAIMNADGSNVRPVEADIGGDAWVTWSPDGRWLAVSSDVEPGESVDPRLDVIAVDGSEQFSVTEEIIPSIQTAWRPTR